MKINPLAIKGPWDVGVTLDVHTESSTFLGYDANDHPQFETARTELGEAVYQAKYRGDRGALHVVARTVAEYLRATKISVDLVVLVPPSKERAGQPLVAIAKAVAGELKIEVAPGALVKLRETPELKSMDDSQAREEALRGAYAVKGIAPGRRILLLDDLYRSGASIREAACTLVQAKPAFVCALALTRNRKRT